MPKSKKKDIKEEDGDSCNCPKIEDEKWNWRWHEWKEKYFYGIRIPSFFYMPLNMGKRYKKLFNDVSKNGYTPKKPVFIIHQNGMFSGKLFIEINKPIKPGNGVVVMQDKNLASRVYYGPYNKITDKVNEFITKIDIKPKKIFYWYTTCPKCVKDKQHKTVIFVEV